MKQFCILLHPNIPTSYFGIHGTYRLEPCHIKLLHELNSKGILIYYYHYLLIATDVVYLLIKIEVTVCMYIYCIVFIINNLQVTPLA